eukprot:1195961-Prorocentrum_minimum.AAC.4
MIPINNRMGEFSLYGRHLCRRRAPPLTLSQKQRLREASARSPFSANTPSCVTSEQPARPSEVSAERLPRKKRHQHKSISHID